MSERFHLIGSPLHDGQDDPPPACSVCGATDAKFVRVPAAERGTHTCLVCHPCLERALKSVGPPTGETHTRACVGRHVGATGPDHEARFQVVAVWPPHSFARPPYWLACRPHLRAALDTAERSAS